jgi:Repeat of unknown function (DUF5648)
MILASIRLGFVLTALVASLHVAAAPRFWTLTDVRFNDGTVATGYLSYDDATQTISNWNVRVDSGLFFPAFSYVPGDSIVNVVQPSGGAPKLDFSATMGVPGPYFGVRQLQITPVAALDGSNATVSLDTSASREDFPSLQPPRGRSIAAGSLTLTPVPPPVTIVQVDEFYNPVLRHYFISADDAEKQFLDAGAHPGWERTGESFKAYARGSSTGGSINPVCRFYSPPIIEWDVGFFEGADSHFFSADPGECLSVFRKWEVSWLLESDNVFQINLPDKGTGACPVGTIPVYRLWNQRVDSNHRYTTSAAIKAQMLAAGYLAEGYGPDGVVMCAVQ